MNIFFSFNLIVHAFGIVYCIVNLDYKYILCCKCNIQLFSNNLGNKLFLFSVPALDIVGYMWRMWRNILMVTPYGTHNCCLGRALRFNEKILAVENWSKWSVFVTCSSNLVPFLPEGFVSVAWDPMSQRYYVSTKNVKIKKWVRNSAPLYI